MQTRTIDCPRCNGSGEIGVRGQREVAGPVPEDARGWVAYDCPDCHGRGNFTFNIATNHVCPPIPDRGADWEAVDDDTYDGECYLVGRGPTEEAAIDDLIERLMERR